MFWLRASIIPEPAMLGRERHLGRQDDRRGRRCALIALNDRANGYGQSDDREDRKEIRYESSQLLAVFVLDDLRNSAVVHPRDTISKLEDARVVSDHDDRPIRRFRHAAEDFD